jgi:hypothetical protein
MPNDEDAHETRNVTRSAAEQPTAPIPPRVPTPDASLRIPTEPDAGSARPRRKGSVGWKILRVVGVIVVALLIASNVALWISLASTRDDLDKAENRSELATEGLTTVSDRVDMIESDDSSSRIDDVESRLEDLQSCVNDYLDAVDASGGGSYRFRFC